MSQSLQMLKQSQSSEDHVNQTFVDQLILFFDNAYDTLINGQG